MIKKINNNFSLKMGHEDKIFDNFWNFFPFYLSQHQNKTNQLLHLLGTVIATLTILISIITLNALTFIFAPIFGYSLAWIGHFFFEKNKPATFRNPIYSLYGDYVMAYYKVTG